MTNFWAQLPKPMLALAPMEGSRQPIERMKALLSEVEGCFIRVLPRRVQPCFAGTGCAPATDMDITTPLT